MAFLRPVSLIEWDEQPQGPSSIINFYEISQNSVRWVGQHTAAAAPAVGAALTVGEVSRFARPPKCIRVSKNSVQEVDLDREAKVQAELHHLYCHETLVEGLQDIAWVDRMLAQAVPLNTNPPADGSARSAHSRTRS